MDAGHLGPVALTPEVVGAFLAARRAEGYVMWLSPKALVPLRGFLWRLGSGPEFAPGLPVSGGGCRCFGGFRGVAKSRPSS